MAGEGSNIGSIFGRLGFQFDPSGSREYEAVRRRLASESDKPITQHLGATVDDSEMNRYQRRLEDIRQRNKRREDFKAKLGADYDPRAFNAYERDLARAKRVSDDQVTSNARLRTSFGAIYGRGGALFAAAGGLYGLVTAFKSVTGAYQESQVSQVKLQTQLKASGLAYRDHAAEIDRVIQKTSQLAGLDDEDLQDAFTNIVRVTGDVNKSLRLTGLAADFARAKHMDVAKAGELVGKVAGGNLGILSRYGIVLKQGATATEALGILQQKFGGQAQAYGRTQAGALDRVQVAWENLRETLGEKLAPLITRIANRLADFINEFDNGTGKGGEFRRTLERIFGVLKDGEHWIKDHVGLIKLAATAWIGYRTAALAAAAASKVAALAAARSGAGAAAGGAAAAGGGAAAGALRGRVTGAAAGAAGLLGGVSGAIVVAGGFKAITDAIRGASNSDLGLLNQYAVALERVAKAGDAGGMRKLAGQLREVARANSDTTKGDHLKAFAAALDQTAKSGGKDLGALKAAFSAMRKSTGGDLEKVRDSVLRLRGTADTELNTKLGRTLDAMNSHFRVAQMGTGDKLESIRRAVTQNMREVKRRLDKDSDDGRQALAHNFEGAVGAVKRQMHSGEISTRDGMKAIRGYLTQELRLYGFSISQAKNIAATGDPDANRGREGGAFRQRGGLVKRARGGWIGGKGMVGDDTVPVGPNALAAPGEFHAAGSRHDAIINRHQAPLANLFMLASGGPFQSLDDLASRGRGVDQVGYLDAAMGPIGGLAGLFSAVQRPHMYARGGNLGGAVAAANQFERAHFPYQWGGGHQASPVPFGPVDCSAAVSYILQHAGINIPTMVSGQLARAGKPGPGPLTVYANAEHTLMRIGNRFFGTSTTNPGGGAGWIDPAPSASYLSRFAVRHFDGAGSFGVNVKAPRIRGGGAVGAVAQRALNVAAGAANRFGNRAVNSMGLGAGDANNVGAGGYSKAQLAALWVRAGGAPGMARLMAAIALAESGGNPSIVNSIGATGLWQIHPGGSQYKDPLTNARTAVSKLRSQGLSAWEAYTNGSYRPFLRRGGLLQRFASGGNLAAGSGSTNRKSGTAQGFPLRALSHRASHRVAAYDRIMGDHGIVDTLRSKYDIFERQYNRIDDGDLVDEQGNVDTRAYHRKIGFLMSMAATARSIWREIQDARAVATRTLKSFRALTRGLQGALKHAKKKDRSGLRTRLHDAQAGVREWKSTLGDLGFDVTNARLDYQDLGGEYKDFTGGIGDAVKSAREAIAGAITGDSGIGDFGADTGSSETPTAAPSAAEIAAAAQQQVASFKSNLQDLYGSFGGNFAATGRPMAAGATGAYGTPAYFGATADVHGGALASSGGGVYVGQITNVYPTPPPDPHTWTRNLEFETKAIG